MRPDPTDRSCFAFLDSIRNRGVTSMALAIPRLRREHHLNTPQAVAVLARWAEHYEARYHTPALVGREVRTPQPLPTRAPETAAALARVAVPILRAAQDRAASLKSALLRYSRLHYRA